MRGSQKCTFLYEEDFLRFQSTFFLKPTSQDKKSKSLSIVEKNAVLQH